MWYAQVADKDNIEGHVMCLDVCAWDRAGLTLSEAWG